MSDHWKDLADKLGTPSLNPVPRKTSKSRNSPATRSDVVEPITDVTGSAPERSLPEESAFSTPEAPAEAPAPRRSSWDSLSRLFGFGEPKPENPPKNENKPLPAPAAEKPVPELEIDWQRPEPRGNRRESKENVRPAEPARRTEAPRAEVVRPEAPKSRDDAPRGRSEAPRGRDGGREEGRTREGSRGRDQGRGRGRENTRPREDVRPRDDVRPREEERPREEVVRAREEAVRPEPNRNRQDSRPQEDRGREEGTRPSGRGRRGGPSMWSEGPDGERSRPDTVRPAFRDEIVEETETPSNVDARRRPERGSTRPTVGDEPLRAAPGTDAVDGDSIGEVDRRGRRRRPRRGRREGEPEVREVLPSFEEDIVDDIRSDIVDDGLADPLAVEPAGDKEARGDRPRRRGRRGRGATGTERSRPATSRAEGPRLEGDEEEIDPHLLDSQLDSDLHEDEEGPTRHIKIPTWADAIGILVDVNAENHRRGADGGHPHQRRRGPSQDSRSSEPRNQGGRDSRNSNPPRRGRS